jgi:hypothetical protein
MSALESGAHVLVSLSGGLSGWLGVTVFILSGKNFCLKSIDFFLGLVTVFILGSLSMGKVLVCLPFLTAASLYISIASTVLWSLSYAQVLLV